MPQLTVFAKDFASWAPDIDPRRSAKPGIISGTNFLDDVDGPRSAFSTNFVNYNLFDATTRAKITELRTSVEILYGTPTGVWRINAVSGIAELILPIVVTNTFWPWNIAYVGAVYYLCQYDIGLWQWDPVAQSMTHIDTPADDKIRGVIESFGRLVYLADTAVAFSALDDGTNLTPSLTTGASAQALSLVGGTAYRLASLPDGFVVYMSQGILRGLFTQAAYVFTLKRLTAAVKVFSPNSGVFIPGIGDISLDPSGFWLTTSANKEPVPWEEEKGDYIKRNIIAFLNQNLFGTICLYYSQAERKLFVEFSSNNTEGLMQSTFVYTVITKTWGSFDHANYGLFETFTTINNIFSCSYMGNDGYMRVFSNTDHTLDLPDDPYVFRDLIYRVTFPEQQIIEFTDASDAVMYIGISEALFSDIIPTAYAPYSGTNLFYVNYTPYSDTNNDGANDPDFDVVSDPMIGGTYLNFDVSGGVEIIALPYSLPKIGLNSILSLGPFRFTEQTYPDETSAVTSLVIGLATTSNFVITEDWNTMSGNEDWNAESGTEDWGSGNTNPNVFQLALRSTDDGINAPVQGDEDLQVMADMGSALRYDTFGYSAIFHILTLSAIDPDEAFSVKYCDFGGQLTGRVTLA